MNSNLNTRDIHGNMPGTRVLGNFNNRERRQVREPGKNDDIDGTKPGSLVIGIKVAPGQKARNNNPLNPDYQYPGHSEMININDDPYGQSHSMLKKP